MYKYFLMAALVLGGAAWILIPEPPASLEGVELSPSRIDIGPAPRGGGQVERTLALTNHRATAVHVSFRLSCACGQVEPQAVVLAPGESQPLRVRVTPPERGADFNLTLTCVEKETGAVLAEAEIRGRATPWLTAELQTVQLEVMGEQGKSDKDFAIRNRSDKPFVGEVTLHGDIADHVTLEPSHLDLAPGAEQALRVKADFPGARRLRGQLEFTETRNGQLVHKMDLVLTGRSPYVSDPPSVLWAADAATPESLSVELSRQDRGEFAVRGARLEPEVSWLSAAVSTAAAEKQKVTLRVAAEGVGKPYVGQLVIDTDRADYPRALPIRVIAAVSHK